MKKVTAHISRFDLNNALGVLEFSDEVTLELTLNLSRNNARKILPLLATKEIEFLFPDSVDFKGVISVIVNDNGLNLKGGSNA